MYHEPFYRLLHAEADGFPGLVCDRFDDVLVLQMNTAGMEALTPALLAAFERLFSPRAIVLRNDSPARSLEGLPLEVKVARGAITEPVEVRESGLKFLADVIAGQKTGWFYDQRDSRAFVAPLAAGGSLLDVYCHTGAFSIAGAAAGARSVLGIDSSARRSIWRGGRRRRTVSHPSAHFGRRRFSASWSASHDASEHHRVVVADPPAFVKSRRDLGSGLRGYRKLARLAAPLVESGGRCLSPPARIMSS